jgi:hypothetical protein
MLLAKLFDDKGNRMGPRFSNKNGVRYRFYISTAFGGRTRTAHFVAPIAVPEIEGFVETAHREGSKHQERKCSSRSKRP